MNRKIMLAAVATAAFVTVGACSKGDTGYNDTAAGAMATPPATYPSARTTTSVTGNTTTTIAPDSGDSARWSNADSARHLTKTTITKTTRTTKTTTKRP